MTDLSGQILGNYLLESSLGTGGMGRVYRARHLHLRDKLAAVKVMHDTVASDLKFREYFLREANAAAALKHPHVVEVLDFGEARGLYYLVMELVPDGSLRGLLLRREELLPLRLGMELVKQAADALSTAHNQGMIHRDIKPENLLVERQGSSDQTLRFKLRVADFGLAQMFVEGGVPTNVHMGAPAYMSPEQFQGVPLDGRSDLYSLGVVLYEVATGHVPFQISASGVDAAYKHVFTLPPSPDSVARDLPAELNTIILRCLAKKPEERFQSAGELSKALSDLLPDVEAPEPPPVVRSNPIKVILGADQLMLSPGHTYQLPVTIANRGKTVEWFRLTAEGVPDEWITTPASQSKLNPGSDQTVQVSIAVPRSPEASAKEYAVTFRAEPLRSGDEAPSFEAVVAQARWIVQPYTADSLTITPTRASGLRRASYRLTLSNGGNCPSKYRLFGTDDMNALDFTFTGLPTQVEPGQSVTVGLEVRAPGRWVGGVLDRGFTVRLDSEGLGDRTARSASVALGQLSQRALLPSWVIPVGTTAMIAAFALWFGQRAPEPPPNQDSGLVPVPPNDTTGPDAPGPTPDPGPKPPKPKPRPAGWSAWMPVPGEMRTDAPASVAALDGQLLVFARRSSDGHMYFNTSQGAGRTWSGWMEVPGSATTDAAVASVAAGGQLYLFAKGIGDKAVYRNRRQVSEQWTGWSELPGSGHTDAALSATSARGLIFVFAKGINDGGIYMNRGIASTDAGWTGWSQVFGSGRTDAPPAATTLGDEVFLFVKGIADQGVYVNRETSGTWSGWRPVPGNFRTDAPLGATGDNGRVLLFAKASGEDKVYMNTLDHQWKGWQIVPRATTSGAATAALYGRGQLLHLFTTHADGLIQYSVLRK